MKRQISYDVSEKTPPPIRDAVTSPLSVMSEDPPAPLLSPPVTDSGPVRTSSPIDSGLDSDEDQLPSYEVMMRETFSPISPAPLASSILSSIDEGPTTAMREDVKPTTEVKAAPPAEAPVATRIDDAGLLGINGPPLYHIPPPNLYLNMSNAPVGSTMAPRATIETPCSRICVLVPSQYAGVVQREYGADPVVTIQATTYNVAGTRNMIQLHGSLPGPSTSFVGPMHVDPMTRVNGYPHMY